MKNTAPENTAVRWKQRYENYVKALERFRESVEVENPTDLQKMGIIKCFEIAHELAWRVMKDFFDYQGPSAEMPGIDGSRDATRLAFSRGLIDDGDVWENMIEMRNRTVHTYDGGILLNDYALIAHVYFPLLKKFCETMRALL